MPTNINPITKTFRQTAAAAQLGRLIFDPNTQGSVTPAMILNLLTAAGLKVPKDLTIGVDAAQVLLSASVLADTIETASSIGSLMSGSLSLVGAVEGLLQAIGVLNFQDPNVMAIKMFGDGCLVISSLGANIYEDIAFIFDMITFSMQPSISDIEHSQNKQLNVTKANDWLKTRLTNESLTAGNQFKDYQAKKISVFEMLGNIAMQSPDVFKNYYPDLAAFFPPVTMQAAVTSTVWSYVPENGGYQKITEAQAKAYIAKGLKVYTSEADLPRETTWFPNGSAKSGISQNGFDTYWKYTPAILKISDTLGFNYTTINPDKIGLEKAFIAKFLEGPFAPYRLLKAMTRDSQIANGYPKNATKLGVFNHANPVFPRIKIEDLAVLSMFPPYFDFLHDDFDLKRVLLGLGITLSELDPAYGMELDSNLNHSDFSQRQLVEPAGLSINGLQIFSQNQIAANNTIKQSNAEINRTLNCEVRGDIGGVLKNPRAAQIVTEFGIMPYLTGSMETTLAADYQKIPMSNPQGYRNIRNYWSAVSLKETMKKDNFFSDSFNNNVFSEVDTYIPDSQFIEQKHRRLQALILYRKFNQIARGHVASFFGTTADKIVMYPPEEGKLARVKQILK